MLGNVDAQPGARGAAALLPAALAGGSPSRPAFNPPTAPRPLFRTNPLPCSARSLAPANASMLLDGGGSMVVPVLPASIYEHTIVARPHFDER